MILPGTEQMKFAMGENPKRCYGTDKKYPMTRMGLAALMRETLYKAKTTPTNSRPPRPTRPRRRNQTSSLRRWFRSSAARCAAASTPTARTTS